MLDLPSTVCGLTQRANTEGPWRVLGEEVWTTEVLRHLDVAPPPGSWPLIIIGHNSSVPGREGLGAGLNSMLVQWAFLLSR